MTPGTLLLRQVHPAFVVNGYASSQAFNPSEEHGYLLSTYDGSQIGAENSYTHYTTVWKKASAGVMAVSVAECTEEGLASRPDPLPDCPPHCVVDFTGLSGGQRKLKSKKLQAKAQARDWQYRAPAAN